MHKSDPNDGFVEVRFTNQESTAREPILDAKELTVIPYEEVEWVLEDFDAIRYASPDSVDFTAYADTITVETTLKDGRVITGEIRIEFDEAGNMYAQYVENP